MKEPGYERLGSGSYLNGSQFKMIESIRVQHHKGRETERGTMNGVVGVLAF